MGQVGKSGREGGEGMGDKEKLQSLEYNPNIYAS
jgi:hypothetical protein